jgi:DNA-binding HxlR family transcriptional regulator
MRIVNKLTYKILCSVYQGKKGFNMIAQETGLTARTLSLYTRELRTMGLITRYASQARPIRTKYGITTDGIKICEMLMEIEKLMKR